MKLLPVNAACALNRFMKENCWNNRDYWNEQGTVPAIPGVTTKDIDTVYETINKLEIRSGMRVLPAFFSRIYSPLKKESKIRWTYFSRYE